MTSLVVMDLIEKFELTSPYANLGARIKILRCDGGVVFSPLEFGLKIFGFT